jgi:hypothetical protein
MRNVALGKLIVCAAIATVPMTIPASAQPLPPTSPPQIAPTLGPAHEVNLMTTVGWRHSAPSGRP